MESIFIGRIALYPFGLAIAAAVGLTVFLTNCAGHRVSVRRGTVSRLAVFCVIFGVLGARLGYCLCILDGINEPFLPFLFRLTAGGYMLYGAMAGALGGAALTAAVTRQSFFKLTDLLAAPSALLISLARLAEGIAGEGYGWDIADWFSPDSGMSVFVLEDPSFFCRFPFGVSDMYGSWNWSVFIFEALIAAAIFLFLQKKSYTRPGGKTCLFLLLYAASQILCESMRQDAVLRFGFVRVNQVVSAILLMALAIFLPVKNEGRVSLRTLLPVFGLLLCFLLITAMEFAIEKKISQIEWLPTDLCYLIIAIACVGIAALIYPQWKRFFDPPQNRSKA